MQKYFTLIVFWSTLTVVGAEAGTTYVSGVIDTNTVWTPAGSPYIVIDTTIVDSGVMLDIEPGVDVRIDSAKYIMIKGTLNAIGTAIDSIIISTLDTTNRWSRLWFKPASAGSLKYCRIEYAGNSAIYGDSASYLYIDYNNISNNIISGVLRGYGAGIYIAGIAKITNNSISNNGISLPELRVGDCAAGCGAGIYNRGSSEIINNTITHNRVFVSTYPGACSFGGGIYTSGSANIIDNIISSNSAGASARTDGSASSRGGGIYSSGVSTISNNTISHNGAGGSGGYSGCGAGGGIYNCGQATITDNSILNNGVSGTTNLHEGTGRGGGIYTSNWAIISNNTISGNSSRGTGCWYTSKGHGGGICSCGDSAQIVNNIITNNEGSSASRQTAISYGGGIYAGGKVNISNNIILNNRVRGNYLSYQPSGSGYGYGGGIFCDSGKIVNNIISSNHCYGSSYYHDSRAGGGGIYALGPVEVTGNALLYNSSTAHSDSNISHEYSDALYLRKYSTLRYNTVIDTDGVAIYSNDGALIDSSNLYSAGYVIFNHSSLDINARHNYWYTMDTSSINARIWDYYDSSGVGTVFYEPFLTSGDTIAPVPPPLNLTATQTNADKITMSWDAVPVSDLAGYKVWYDTDTTDYPYEGTGANEGNSPIDVGNVTTFDLTGLAQGDQYLVVCAYDVGGDSSWYSNEAIVTVVGVEENAERKIQNAKLEIYPNPFVQKTSIQYSIPNRQHISLKIYDIAGRCVKTLVNGKKEPGCYKISWDTKELGTGIYFATLTTANHKLAKKIILIKQ